MENLRDDFAKRAMGALISGSMVRKVPFWIRFKWFFGFKMDNNYSHGIILYSHASELAYSYADAMIKEREKRLKQ